MLAKSVIKKLDDNIPKLALLIGIGYTNTNLEISDPYNDLQGFITYLINIGFQNDSIIILTDSIAFDNSAMPTHVNIITYMDDLVKFSEKNKNAHIVFYYTGHGTRFEDKNKIKEAIVPVNFHNAHCINGEIIKKVLIDRLDETSTIFCMIDCCYSGNIINLKNKYIGQNRYLNNKFDTSKCKAFSIGSSKKNQISLKYLIELGNKNRGKKSLMTWAFCDMYRTNSALYSLIVNMQLFLNGRFKDAQNIQLLSNQDIDTKTICIPELVDIKNDFV